MTEKNEAKNDVEEKTDSNKVELAIDALEKRVKTLEDNAGVGRGFYIKEAAEKLRTGGIRRYIGSLPVSDEEKEEIWQGAYMAQEGRKPKRTFAHALSLLK